MRPGSGVRRRSRPVVALASVLAQLRGRREVSRVEIVLALPRGCERVRTRARFLDRAEAEPDLCRVRTDFQEHLLAWIRYHATRADWPRGITLPGRQVVCDETGMCASTYKACRAWWAERGYVAVVREGRTEEYRRKSRRRDVAQFDGNEARVLLLCVPKRTKRATPASRESATPLTRPPQSSVSEGNPRAREARPVDKPGDGQGREGPALRAGRLAGLARTPALAAVPADLAAHPVLQRLSDAALSQAWAPFAARGWTPSAWLFAINHRPGVDGGPARQHFRTGRIRQPAGWLQWRLSFWLDEHGMPVLSVTQQAAVRRLDEWRDRQAAALPPKTPGAEPPGPELGRIRAELARLNWERKEIRN